MSSRDYYEVLGVSKDVSQTDLKKAYRKKAMQYHPDRNKNDQAGSEKKFKEVQEAYDVLSDDQKRQMYDQVGPEGMQQGAAGGFHGGFGDIFNDIFSDMFGGGGEARGGHGHRASHGADLKYGLEMSLEEAINGGKVNIRIPTWVQCGGCHGSGAKKGARPVSCETCDGHGQVRMQQGFFTIQQTCPKCGGSGQVIRDPCHTCHGQGRVKDHKTLNVKVPAGVDEGDRIRLAGEGEAPVGGGVPGDLYVQIHVREHPIFKREENHLFCEVPINLVMAALGGEMEVPTLDGRVKLKIPPGTQTGKTFKLRGKGVTSVHGGGKGDLLCRVLLETPIDLSRKQREILNEFQKETELSRKHFPKVSSWFDRMKVFLDNMKS